MSERLVLVVNPTAGKGRALTRLPEVVGTLRDAGLEPEVRLSRSFDEAEELARDAVRGGCTILAVMGGDGMMHLGVNAVAGTPEIALGLIPAGTGNDLCRGLGLNPRDPVAAAALMASGKSRAVDVAEVNGRRVGAVIGTGFDALVNRRANAMARPKGALRYPVAVLAELRTFAPLHYRLTIDGTVRELDAMLVAVGNTCCYGGGMQICPDADPTDGLLDVTIIHEASRAKLIRLLPQMFSGRFARDPCVERLRARDITVDGPGLVGYGDGELVGYGDGELIGPAPLRITVRPAAVRIFAPLRS